MAREQRLFVLEQPRAETSADVEGGTRAFENEVTERGEAPKCPTCGRFLGQLVWLPPYRVELETFGAQYGDIVQLGSDLLVSERFRLIYAESGLCGLTGFDPVEVVKVKRRGKRLGSPPAYFKAAVPRTRAAIDQSASEFVWEDPTSICHDCRIDGIIKSYRRVILEAGTWTGEDIFYARGSTGVQIVTSRFRETCEANRILNVVFIPAEEYGHDWS